mmetsp:Transcript_92513/g.267081  ORF Transcript_92513/g.267081 Transcript_92513/m.267081 type:complete len:616 (+) Transcript_92513:253-2100(+)
MAMAAEAIMEPLGSALGSDRVSARGSVCTMTESMEMGGDLDIDVERLRLPKAYWPCDILDLKEQTCRQFVTRIVDSTLMEVVVSSCVFVDLMLTFLLLTVAQESDIPYFTILTAVLLGVLLVDVCLRVIKDGSRFFYKPLNCLELLVAWSACSLVLFQLVAQNLSSAGIGGKSTAIGRTLRPLLRAFRIIRVSTRVCQGHSALRQKADRWAKQLVLRKMARFLAVPPENTDIRPSFGHFHVEKAQVNSRLLSRFHLPFTVSAGVLGMVHIEQHSTKQEAPVQSWWSFVLHAGCLRRAKRTNCLVVVVEDLLLVVGPGHHQELSAPPWTFDSVKECKQELVDLLDKFVPKKPKKPGKPVRFKEALKRKAMKSVERMLTRGVKVSIRNVELRFEDALHGSSSHAWPLGLSGPSGVDGALPAVSAGIRVGSIQVRTKGGKDSDSAELSVQSRGRWRGDTTSLSYPQAQSVTMSSALGRPSGLQFPEGEAGTVMNPDESSVDKLDRMRSRRKRPSDMSLRIVLECQQLAAFWDTEEPTELNGASRRYTERLREGQTGIPGFLRVRAKRRQLERVGLAVCAEVERRLNEAEDARYEKLRSLWAARGWTPELPAQRKQRAA